MLGRINTFVLFGVDAVPVEVEAETRESRSQLIVAGTAKHTLSESVARAERALAALGYDPCAGRVIVNLLPDVPIEGGSLDLPVALAMLVATRQLLPDHLKDFGVIGEFELDGSMRPVRGALSIAMAAAQWGLKKLLLPLANARGAAIVEAVHVYGVKTLAEAIGIVCGLVPADPVPPRIEELFGQAINYGVDFAEVYGQEFAKRALIVAAAGGHNTLISGPRGSGKTTLAQRFRTILPVLSPEESLERTRIQSALGLLNLEEPFQVTRPFREIGQREGRDMKAHEISLAEGGVLFVDDLGTCDDTSLAVLRRALDGDYPSMASDLPSASPGFIFMAAMARCPCGYSGGSRQLCSCTPAETGRYLDRVIWLLADRIDIHVEVVAHAERDLAQLDGASSAAMRAQVAAARRLQGQRFGAASKTINGGVSGWQLATPGTVDKEGRALLDTAKNDLGLSAAAQDRVLCVARTIADLDESEAIKVPHISEAMVYRVFNGKWMQLDG